MLLVTILEIPTRARNTGYYESFTDADVLSQKLWLFKIHL